MRNDGNHKIAEGSHVCDACAVETRLTGSTRWYYVNGTWTREAPPCKPVMMVPDRKGGVTFGGQR